MANRKSLILLGLFLFLLVSPVSLRLELDALLGQINRPVFVGSFDIPAAHANELISEEAALQKLFPDADEFTQEKKEISEEDRNWVEEEARVTMDPSRDASFVFHVAKQNGEIIGYATSDAVPGKWGPIYYIIAFKPDGSVKDTIVLAYEEKRGKPVAKKRFLKQFRKKNIDDPVRLMRDIRGVTGASMSSSGMANGVRKMIHIFHKLYGGAA